MVRRGELVNGVGHQVAHADGVGDVVNVQTRVGACTEASCQEPRMQPYGC